MNLVLHGIGEGSSDASSQEVEEKRRGRRSHL